MAFQGGVEFIDEQTAIDEVRRNASARYLDRIEKAGDQTFTVSKSVLANDVTIYVRDCEYVVEPKNGDEC